MNPFAMAAGGGMSASSGPAVSGANSDQKTTNVLGFGDVNLKGDSGLKWIGLGLVALGAVFLWKRN